MLTQILGMEARSADMERQPEIKPSEESTPLAIRIRKSKIQQITRRRLAGREPSAVVQVGPLVAMNLDRRIREAFGDASCKY